LEAYDRNQNFAAEEIALPNDELPDWPQGGFRQLQEEHRAHFPKVSKDQLEAYFIHRLATDHLKIGDGKAIEKGINLTESGCVKACSVQITQKDIYLTGIVAAAMKKKISYNYKLRLDGQSGDIINSHCECPAGKGPHGTCKHIASVVLLLAQFVQEGHLNIAKSCTEQLQSFHRPQKFHTGSPIKAPQIPMRKRSAAGEDDDPRPEKLRNMPGYDDFFRNTMINYEAETNHGLGMRFLMEKADLQEAMHDHTYTKIPFGRFHKSVDNVTP